MSDVCFVADSVDLGNADGSRACVGTLTCGKITVGGTCQQGDCNGDQQVDPGDLVCMVNRFFGDIPQVSTCEDCNRDGMLDSVDAVCIVLCASDASPPQAGAGQ